MNLIRLLYGIRDSSLCGDSYEIVVPLDYGSIPKGNDPLPDSTKKCLDLAVKLVLSGKVDHIVWGSTDYFGLGACSLDKTKQAFIHSKGLQNQPLCKVVSNNSIQEALLISKALPNVKKVLIVCDWPHARRTRFIWRHFYPDSEIGIISVSAEWNQDHPSVWQKSAFRWILANILHHALLKFRGINNLINVVHKLDR